MRLTLPVQNGGHFNLHAREHLLKILLILIALAALVTLVLRLSGSGAIPELGTVAPDFDLPDAENHHHRLVDYRGRWLVLYFYPRDATPVCTAEACNLRDGYLAFKERNTALLGVSLDDAASHAEFAQQHQLPFPLLSDKDAILARAYGSLWDFGVFRIAKRHTFLIDPSGRIAKVYRDVVADRHAQTILADLDRLQADGREY